MSENLIDYSEVNLDNILTLFSGFMEIIERGNPIYQLNLVILN